MHSSGQATRRRKAQPHTTDAATATAWRRRPLRRRAPSLRSAPQLPACALPCALGHQLRGCAMRYGGCKRYQDHTSNRLVVRHACCPITAVRRQKPSDVRTVRNLCKPPSGMRFDPPSHTVAPSPTRQYPDKTHAQMSDWQKSSQLPKGTTALRSSPRRFPSA